MTSKEENERLLTHDEVTLILEESLKKPQKIYDGPEEDQTSSRRYQQEQMDQELAEDEEVEVDPLAELSFEKRATIDHVNTFTRIKNDNAIKMVDDLVKIERITNIHAFKIAELMPRDETELRPVFAKDRFTLEPEVLSQILSIIDENRK
jgi:DNA-directed RNA polymerase subunit F